MSLDVITIPPASGQPPVGLVVVLHGWGANAKDLASVVPVLNLPDFEFICPNAPFSHPRMSTGKAWYNLERQDYKGLVESRQILTDWLKSLESTTGVPLSRTILCGFSQGAAMTLDVGLTLPLAGLICLSGYLHPNPQPAGKISTPILIVHGRQDYMVPLRAAQQARDTLIALKLPVQYQEYDMGHEIVPAAIVLMRSFIVETVSNTR
ncbi:MAG: alpha/beta hydrolase [Microcoleus vaginatus WJT46-NPBG5]|nr:alpha/beta hydrolase [Microcoleus vaginatus WJT46-NPBG5]